jgi:hypothetical protein
VTRNLQAEIWTRGVLFYTQNFNITMPIFDITSDPETETNFLLGPLSRFHLKTETESSLQNVVFLNKGQDDAYCTKL